MPLIKQATIIDSRSSWNGKKVDILIQNNRIKAIAHRLQSQEKQVIEGQNLFVSNSWIDIGCHLNEPGNEHKETIEELARRAKRGGYGTIVPKSKTRPALNTKSAIEYILSEAKKNKIKILPIAEINASEEKENLAEMLDISSSGCRLFSDASDYSMDPGLLQRALLYVKSFGGLIAVCPLNKKMSKDGQVHEGSMSTQNGMVGIPSMAEFTALYEQLAIAQYADSDICVVGVSTKESVKLLKSNKGKTEQNIYSTVPYLNLLFTDSELRGFDSNLKVLPPLRSKSDKKALIKGLLEGTITAISSNHSMHDLEAKDLEFAYASFGASGIETVFSALNTYCPRLPLELLIGALTEGPRSILNIDQPIIEVGVKAEITVFDKDASWTLDSDERNPFHGKRLIGKVLRVF